jgi:hypothetical protein
MRGAPFEQLAVLLALAPTTSQESGNAITASTKSVSGTRPGSSISELERFLQMNPEERFDIETINSIEPQTLIAEAKGDRRLLREIVRTAYALLPRVRAETEDPLLVSAILRSKTLDWYRRSAADPTWGEITPLRWGGIFYESRVPGGRLSRKLSTRLSGLITECVEAAGARAFLRAGFTGLFRGSKMMASMVQFGLGSKRPRLTQLVAQAYLDDLAATGRDPRQPLPLEHLSDLARRMGSQEVNVTLTDLFPQETTTSLTVLDARFHPGMDTVSVRVVPPKSPEDPSTYDLVHASGHRAAHESRHHDESSAGANASSVWDRAEIEKQDWIGLFRSLQKRKLRLDPPPRDSRERESYMGLRDLVIADPAVRKGFLAVHWKGKPAGMALLAQVLTDGTWTPDVETDGDYLEAELDLLSKGDGKGRAKDGHWVLPHGWTIVRQVENGNVRTYRAQAKSAD